ncbi:hypothetical protein BH11BAC5_BH11BAC5_42820 [soil metagenome]
MKTWEIAQKELGVLFWAVGLKTHSRLFSGIAMPLFILRQNKIKGCYNGM